MDKDLKYMYDVAMGSLIDKYASNAKFFTQKEFEENRGEIFLLTNANSKLTEKLKGNGQ